MAELLIYAKNHWMDSLTESQVDERSSLDSVFRKKYNARYQQGDIVEIRENGYWSERGFNRKAFVVIKITDLQIDNKYVERYDSDIFPMRRKWRIRKEDLPAGVIQQLKDTGVFTTTKSAAINYFTDKVS